MDSRERKELLFMVILCLIIVFVFGRICCCSIDDNQVHGIPERVDEIEQEETIEV
tara:strand:+ start:708 stop:872 length:165 start_codon:yes stop_codon:yes gene_type:complete